MLLLRLTRGALIPTLGVLHHEGIPYALTLERPWLDNRRRDSCIPDGRYVCKPVDSPRFGHTWQVMDVPGRSEILFHKGNIEADTHGCILVGEQFGKRSEELEIVASKVGFEEFLGVVRGRKSFPLTIAYSTVSEAL